MFNKIKVSGLGPHTDTDLTLFPTGRTEIRGHSQHGKSVLIDALLFVLYGVVRGSEPFDVEAMSADKLSISLTTPTGREFAVTRTRKGAPKWSYTYQGETLPQTAAKGWIDALSMARLPLWTGGPVRRDAIALCLEPLAWTRLAVSSPTESRKLRDLLVSTAGATSDEAAKELYLKAGHTWTSEPMAEKAAAPLVTEANRALSAATGAAEQARASLSAIEAAAPVEADTSAADGLPDLEAAEGLWSAYDREVAAYQRSETVRAADRTRFGLQVNGWRATCERLKEHDEAAIISAERAHKETVTAWEAERDTREARYAADVKQAAVEHRNAIETRAERMAAAYTDTRRRHAAAEQSAEEDYQRDLAGHAERITKLTTEHDRAVDLYSERVARIEREHTAAVADWQTRCTELRTAHGLALLAHADEVIARDRWQALVDAVPVGEPCPTCGSVPDRLAAIGPCPAVRPSPGHALLIPDRPVAEVAGSPPVAPTLPPEPTRRTVPAYQAPAPEAEPVARTVAPLGPMRPAPVYVAPAPSPRPPEPVLSEPAPLVEPVAPTVERPASEAIRAAQTAVAARRTHAAQLAEHGRTVTRLREALTQAEAGQIRAQATADRAAAWLAAVRAAPGEVLRRLEWLGKIGDGITAELPAEGPAVVVKIDGRPWKLASTGRIICADAHFRRAFADALGAKGLPVIVDNRGAWTGAIDVAGPVIELVTDPAAERLASIV